MNKVITIPSMFMKDYDYYAYRIKHVNKLTLEKTFENMGRYKYHLVSEEGQGSDLHHHGLIGTKNKSTVDIRSQIKKIYPDAKGNKCLSVSIVKSVKQTTKYTLKEGKFLFKGFDKEFIRQMHKCSTKKENLTNKIRDNEEALLTQSITWTQFKINYIEIKVEHGQNLYLTHIKSYFNRFILKSKQISTEDYVDRFLSDD